MASEKIYTLTANPDGQTGGYRLKITQTRDILQNKSSFIVTIEGYANVYYTRGEFTAYDSKQVYCNVRLTTGNVSYTPIDINNSSTYLHRYEIGGGSVQYYKVGYDVSQYSRDEEEVDDWLTGPVANISHTDTGVCPAITLKVVLKCGKKGLLSNDYTTVIDQTITIPAGTFDANPIEQFAITGFSTITSDMWGYSFINTPETITVSNNLGLKSAELVITCYGLDEYGVAIKAHNTPYEGWTSVQPSAGPAIVARANWASARFPPTTKELSLRSLFESNYIYGVEPMWNTFHFESGHTYAATLTVTSITKKQITETINFTIPQCPLDMEYLAATHTADHNYSLFLGNGDTHELEWRLLPDPDVYNLHDSVAIDITSVSTPGIISLSGTTLTVPEDAGMGAAIVTIRSLYCNIPNGLYIYPPLPPSAYPSITLYVTITTDAQYQRLYTDIRLLAPRNIGNIYAAQQFIKAELDTKFITVPELHPITVSQQTLPSDIYQIMENLFDNTYIIYTVAHNIYHTDYDQYIPTTDISPQGNMLINGVPIWKFNIVNHTSYLNELHDAISSDT